MSTQETDDSAGGTPDLDAALEALDAHGLEGFEFVVNADGSVTFVDFPPELLDIAYALNPDDPLVCERMALFGDGEGSGGGEG